MTAQTHRCKPEYVAEGEVVCFARGSHYIFDFTIPADELPDWRADQAAVLAAAVQPPEEHRR